MLKKAFSIILAFSLMAGSSIVTAGAVEDVERMSTSLTDEVVDVLTDVDFNACYEELLKYKDENPDCTDSELDNVAVEYYTFLCEGKSAPASFGDYLPGGYKDLNSEEKALVKKYPSDAAAVYSSASYAERQAEKRYFAGKFIGNWDAFRHTAWSGLLVCRFYALGKGDYSWCANRAELWLTAHETGADEPNDGRSPAQFRAECEMDLFNNRVGRTLTSNTYTSEVETLEKAQRYVDNGNCRRIRTDEQRDFYDREMYDIPNWVLRPTNTSGKR